MRFSRAALMAASSAVLLMAQAPAPSPAPATAPAGAPTPAMPPVGTDPVVAKVNGEDIKLSDVQSAAQTLPPQYRGMPIQTLFPLLLDQMVDQKALLAMAHKQNLDQDPGVKSQMAHAQEQALQNALITRTVGPEVSEPAVRAKYDKDMAGKTGEEEVHARHILVESEDEAKKLIADLKGGGDFAALAKQHSKDPGSADGGDLGFFKKGDMVPPFASAAFALKPGQTVDAPVHTQYGWHVIQVLERRAAPAPTFEQSRDQIRQQMIQEGVQKLLAQARSGAKVEKFAMDGSPEKATDTAQPPADPSQPAPK